ncbi:MAG: ribosome-binding factor A [Elusimicrobia bacterium]|nr:MAG: ribosome-binding factor A [Elusimicrobiota bacterium]KAF0155187.1 MAG: ribosome-binding factor A [Elusimicrobiota bacterium]
MFKRSERLNELFIAEVNFALRDVNGLNSNGIVTITGVKISPDGKDLAVFYSVLGSPQDREKSGLILQRAVREVRESLRKRLRLKYIPNLAFRYDSTPEEAAKLEKVFRRIESQKPPQGEDKGDEEKAGGTEL